MGRRALAARPQQSREENRQLGELARPIRPALRNGAPVVRCDQGARRHPDDLCADRFPLAGLRGEIPGAHAVQRSERAPRERAGRAALSRQGEKGAAQAGLRLHRSRLRPARARGLGQPAARGVAGREVRLSRFSVHRLADARRHGGQIRDDGDALPEYFPPRAGRARARLLPARTRARPRLRCHAGPRHRAAHRGRHRQPEPGHGLARRPALVQKPDRAELRHGWQEPVPRRAREPRRRARDADDVLCRRRHADDRAELRPHDRGPTPRPVAALSVPRDPPERAAGGRLLQRMAARLRFQGESAVAPAHVLQHRRDQRRDHRRGFRRRHRVRRARARPGKTVFRL